MFFFLISLIICLIFPVLLKKVLVKSNLFVKKEKPMFLGISIYFSTFLVFIMALFYTGTDTSFLLAIFAGSSFMLLVGVLDDIKEFSVKTKLIGQIIAAIIVIFMGVKTSIVYFPDWLNAGITLIWIVALVNAFNFLDIMDGLCTGISFIISLTFLAMSFAFGSPYAINLFFLILSGAILAAFIYNKPSAKFYLGDSGSMLIGFIFACSTMQIRYAPDIRHGLALLVPVIIVALPLYDLIFTIYMRWKKGKAISKKSGEHFALILKDKGYGTKKILIVMYAFCLFLSLSAFFLKVLPVHLKPWVLVFLGVIIIMLNVFISKKLKIK